MPLYANEKELFPLREIKLGDSAEKLRANYPGVLYSTNASGEKMLFITIKDNKYWKEAWITVREGRIVIKTYVSVAAMSKLMRLFDEDFEDKALRELEAEYKKGKDNLPLILKDLFAVLGKNFDFGLNKDSKSIKKSEICTVLIWGRDDYEFSLMHWCNLGMGEPNDSSPLIHDYAILVLSEAKKESLDKYYELSKDKKVTKELKKEWDAYFSSLEE